VARDSRGSRPRLAAGDAPRRADGGTPIRYIRHVNQLPPPSEPPLATRILLDRRYGLVRTGLALLILPAIGGVMFVLFLLLLFFGRALFEWWG
jgi:hypothetical protein